MSRVSHTSQMSCMTCLVYLASFHMSKHHHMTYLVCLASLSYTQEHPLHMSEQHHMKYQQNMSREGSLLMHGTRHCMCG